MAGFLVQPHVAVAFVAPLLPPTASLHLFRCIQFASPLQTTVARRIRYIQAQYIFSTPALGVVGAVLAVDETVILLHPPLPLVGVSIVMEGERQQK